MLTFTNTKLDNQIITVILYVHVKAVSVGVGMEAGVSAAVSRRHVGGDAAEAPASMWKSHRQGFSCHSYGRERAVRTLILTVTEAA